MLPWRTFCCWSLTGGLWAIILFLEHFVSDSASTMSRTGTLLAIYLQVARLSLAIGLVGVIYGRRSTFSRVLFRWPWEGWTWALSCVLFLPLSLTWFSGGQKSMSADGKRTRFGSSANWLVAIEDPLPCTNSPKSNGLSEAGRSNAFRRVNRSSVRGTLPLRPRSQIGRGRPGFTLKISGISVMTTYSITFRLCASNPA